MRTTITPKNFRLKVDDHTTRATMRSFLSILGEKIKEDRKNRAKVNRFKVSW